MSEYIHTELQVEDPDDFYTRLIGLHEGLSAAQSTSLNCKLVLLMANHIGDREALLELLGAARRHLPRA